MNCAAESTTGVLISTERTAAATGGELPEDIGREGAMQLLEEIWKGTVLDLLFYVNDCWSHHLRSRFIICGG
jgi:hypothetical protein